MQVRKDRTHLYGATNLDFRSSSESLPTLPSVTPKLTKMTHIDLLSSPKKNFDAILKSKYLKKTSPSPDPLVETYSFYKEKGKPRHEIIKMSNNREKQLEKTGRNPFTGESNTVYDERLFSNNYDYKSEIFAVFLVFEVFFIRINQREGRFKCGHCPGDPNDRNRESTS